jgi:hypothetical protein
MKKLLLLALAITTILCFASCGTNNSSQENELPTDNLKKAIDSISSANSLSYTIKSEQIWKSDTDTTTNIGTAEYKVIKDPFVMWTKNVFQTNAQPKQGGETYQKFTKNGFESAVRGEGTEWQKSTPLSDQAEVQKLADYYNIMINAEFYLLSANLNSFKMDDNKDGLVKYSGTISQTSVVENYKMYIRDSLINTNLLNKEIDKEISNDEILKEITSGENDMLMAGIPGLAFADKPIPVTVWVNEKNNTIAKYQIDKMNAIQAIMNLGEKDGKVLKVEKAISTFEVIGINTFDELPMPE